MLNKTRKRVITNKIKHWLVLAVCCRLAVSSIDNSAGAFYTPVSKFKDYARNFYITYGNSSIVTTIGSLNIARLLKNIIISHY